MNKQRSNRELAAYVAKLAAWRTVDGASMARTVDVDGLPAGARVEHHNAPYSKRREVQNVPNWSVYRKYAADCNAGNSARATMVQNARKDRK